MSALKAADDSDDRSKVTQAQVKSATIPTTGWYTDAVGADHPPHPMFSSAHLHDLRLRYKKVEILASNPSNASNRRWHGADALDAVFPTLYYGRVPPPSISNKVCRSVQSSSVSLLRWPSKAVITMTVSRLSPAQKGGEMSCPIP